MTDNACINPVALLNMRAVRTRKKNDYGSLSFTTHPRLREMLTRAALYLEPVRSSCVTSPWSFAFPNTAEVSPEHSTSKKQSKGRTDVASIDEREEIHHGEDRHDMPVDFPPQPRFLPSGKDRRSGDHTVPFA